jgi:GT2 family glycosyltransferase/glycosyltransferase involved in cell wall biosynthesis
MARLVSNIRYLKAAAALALDALLEGRLPLSPKRWLVDLRHLRAVMTEDVGPAPAATAVPSSDESGRLRNLYIDSCRTALEAFLAGGDELHFASHRNPTISVLVVVYNQAELTLRCLQALHEHATMPIEVVIVDNGSTDHTSVLLSRVPGAHIIRPGRNLGFLRACNLAAGAARGEHLLFLNNDTEVHPESLTAALDVAERSSSVGAVGGRLILPDGRLQEAGSIIWNDGSCLGYGRGDSPSAAPYAFVRDVDYCSAAFLLTPRQLFLELGGFDERYQPAYYEDADYCVRVWKAGKRVVYTPRARVTHVEFASSGSASAAVAMQLERQAIFVDAHREWLAGQLFPSTGAVIAARHRHSTGQRILVVDDGVPRRTIGFGYPRATSLLSALVELGHFVTLLPVSEVGDSWDRVYESIPREIEVVGGKGPQRVRELFRDRDGYYDVVLVSRSHNMALLREMLGPPDRWMRNTRVVYDAEAITAAREVMRRRLLGEKISESYAQRLVAAELALARDVDAVLAVSEDERRQFEELASGRVHVVSHLIEPEPTTREFRERTGFLFVGSFHESSPNADAVVWFTTQVIPLLRERLAEDVSFTIVGQDPPDEVLRLRSECISVLGSVPDLRPLYDRARVFVAPTRFAAGIPFKVGHAAAHGLPVVCTSLLASQLGWRDSEELLVADSPASFAAACEAIYRDESVWARVRAGALARVGSDYAPSVFSSALSAVLTRPSS